MTPISRRAVLQQLTLGAVAAGAAATLPSSLAAQSSSARSPGVGRVRQSVCRWCFANTPLETLCAEGKKMGLQSIELLQPTDFPTIKKHGLACAMVSNPIADFGSIKVGPIAKAWNRKEHHDTLVAAYENQLKFTAEAGFPNVI